MTREESIKLTVKSLLEVVQTGAKNIEITIMDGFGKVSVCYPFSNLDIYYMHTVTLFQNLDLAQIETIVSEIEREKEAGTSILSKLRKYTILILFRGRAEALKISSNRRWTSFDDFTGSSWGCIDTEQRISVFSVFINFVHQPSKSQSTLVRKAFNSIFVFLR